jgi:hypothetical protein
MDMELIYFMVLWATLLGGFVFICSEMRGIRREIKQDLLIVHENINFQSQRSDDLYRMFIDLVKENRNF